MKIKFDLEGRMEDEAFFALYAGLRMYKEQKDSEYELSKQLKQIPKGAFSIPAAEAYCLLMDLKEKFPKMYREAEEEYNEVYHQTK